MKGLRVIKIVKEIKFEGVLVELEATKCFQRQPFTKYLRQLSFPCEIAHYGRNLISVFQEFFAGIDKSYILAGRLGTRLSFYED